ncbi:hypothetical protein B0H14DRAFT_2652168 [Mycena olivaceomarginata]|nr:hypothetical protein B0H14DRAFT_2652168 [Mycena olivaceomarginata]
MRLLEHIAATPFCAPALRRTTGRLIPDSPRWFPRHGTSSSNNHRSRLKRQRTPKVKGNTPLPNANVVRDGPSHTLRRGQWERAVAVADSCPRPDSSAAAAAAGTAAPDPAPGNTERKISSATLQQPSPSLVGRDRDGLREDARSGCRKEEGGGVLYWMEHTGKMHPTPNMGLKMRLVGTPELRKAALERVFADGGTYYLANIPMRVRAVLQNIASLVYREKSILGELSAARHPSLVY